MCYNDKQISFAASDPLYLNKQNLGGRGGCPCNVYQSTVEVIFVLREWLPFFSLTPTSTFTQLITYYQQVILPQLFYAFKPSKCTTV